MAAVASRINNSPGMSNKTAPSPKTKKAYVKTEESQPQVPSIVQPEDNKSAEGSKDTSAPTTNAPLAPPPKPNQNGDIKESGDYFGQQGAGQSQNNQGPNGVGYFSKEPNPFENAFGAPSETPGKTQLPGVTSLTSPAPLLGGSTPGWPGSLRSGPLSPAMLTGPANNDYFSNDHHFSGSFPTPNESSLRTGLTPGGGGSMFPQPSPNSQAIFNAMQSGGATPGTLDFHRTAMHARAASQQNTTGNGYSQNAPTSQPQQDPNIQPNLDSKGFNAPGQQQQSQQQHNQPQQHQQQHQQREQFEQHDTDAANGLFMLAQARQNQSQPGQYPPPQQQSQMNYMQNAPHLQNQAQHNDSANNLAKRAAKNSVGSNVSGSTQNGEDGFSESGASEQAKPSTKGRTKKGSNTKSANNRRKAEETPSKPNKRQKGNSGSANPMSMEDEDDSEMDEDLEVNENGRKLTDEEKRKNFLERNRIAALKCRQRKKQWLANLQQKVEIFSTENDALAATVTQLREEIVGLKTLLLAHKDCPVSQAQGISGMAMQNIAGEPQQYANPYGMGMQQHNHNMQHGMQNNMQRR